MHLLLHFNMSNQADIAKQALLQAKEAARVKAAEEEARKAAEKARIEREAAKQREKAAQQKAAAARRAARVRTCLVACAPCRVSTVHVTQVGEMQQLSQVMALPMHAAAA